MLAMGFIASASVFCLVEDRVGFWERRARHPPLRAWKVSVGVGADCLVSASLLGWTASPALTWPWSINDHPLPNSVGLCIVEWLVCFLWVWRASCSVHAQTKAGSCRVSSLHANHDFDERGLLVPTISGFRRMAGVCEAKEMPPFLASRLMPHRVLDSSLTFQDWRTS